MRKLIDSQHAQRERPAKTKAGKRAAHDSAEKHVTGRAEYVDDLREYPDQLHVAVAGSAFAHARIRHIDLAAVRAAEGVVDVITATDIPGHHDIGPVFPGDFLLVDEICEFVGQPIFAVAATSTMAARRAVKLANIDYEELPAVLSIDEARVQEYYVRPPHNQLRGDADQAIAQSPHRLQGEVYVKGQEHLYLEGQVCSVLPTEDGGVFVHSSSQHPSEVQKLVAEVLDLPIHQVQVEVRRMGGAFGGKETQAASLACMAAIFTLRTGRPVKYRMSRQDDMTMTGKRHDFHNHYEVGVDEHGIIQGAKIELAGKCGNSPDLSDAIVDRAMFHCDNAYYLNQAAVTGLRCKTHTVSNTAFRGFGGPQGMVLAELMMDDIARHLGEDPLTIRKRNLYGVKHDHIRLPNGDLDPRNETHYGQPVEENVLTVLIENLEKSGEYWKRREAIKQFNATSAFMKKGLALTPVKFGISFTVQYLNQAGALLHIYTDGSIHLNHGGTEMGQGLYIKVAQVVAEAFQVDLDRIQVSAARTDKVPNTSPTAASSGSDLNGMAALDAAETIKARLFEFAQQHYGVIGDSLHFDDNHLCFESEKGAQRIPFPELVQAAYMDRVSLSATGYYRTPKIHYDRTTGKGRPFYYFANGAALSEVLVDTLTGEYKVTRVDILHDVGKSLNPAIDIGQIEGGFAQGMGWLTTEDLCWDDKGRVSSNSPATYKIPTAGDIPTDFRVQLLENSPNQEATIYRSKAVGEPPLMLAISVWSAIRDAIASLANYRFSPPLNTPATPECVWHAVKATEAYLNQKDDQEAKT